MRFAGYANSTFWRDTPLKDLSNAELFRELFQNTVVDEMIRGSNEDVREFLNRLPWDTSDKVPEAHQLLVSFELFTRAMMEGLYRTETNRLESIALLVRAYQIRCSEGVVAFLFDKDRRLIQSQVVHKGSFTDDDVRSASYLVELFQAQKDLKPHYVVFAIYVSGSSAAVDSLRHSQITTSLVNPLVKLGIETIDVVVADRFSYGSYFEYLARQRPCTVRKTKSAKTKSGKVMARKK